MRRSRLRKKKSRSKSKCKSYLRNKIKRNMEELKKGLYKNPAQAIAVSYNQVQKKHPSCKRVLRL